jgi:hypothetical protein
MNSISNMDLTEICNSDNISAYQVPADFNSNPNVSNFIAEELNTYMDISNNTVNDFSMSIECLNQTLLENLTPESHINRSESSFSIGKSDESSSFSCNYNAQIDQMLLNDKCLINNQNNACLFNFNVFEQQNVYNSLDSNANYASLDPSLITDPKLRRKMITLQKRMKREQEKEAKRLMKETIRANDRMAKSLLSQAKKKERKTAKESSLSYFTNYDYNGLQANSMPPFVYSFQPNQLANQESVLPPVTYPEQAYTNNELCLYENNLLHAAKSNTSLTFDLENFARYNHFDLTKNF